MLARHKADPQKPAEVLSTLPARAADADAETERAVRAIVDDVRERGDLAVAEYAHRFDGQELARKSFEISERLASISLRTALARSFSGPV